MKILVCYATGSGSTREVAEAIAEELQGPGVSVDVLPAGSVEDIGIYQGAVVGSSIRLGRWLPDAMDFLTDFRAALGSMPVAYFTTCMTMVKGTEAARRTVLSYLEPVIQLAPEVIPVGLGLFSGSLEPTFGALPELSGPYGDFRNWDAIRLWAREIRPSFLIPEGSREDLQIGDATVLSFSNLSGYDLSRFDLAELEMAGADLRAANLQKSDLRQANMKESDLSGAKLQGAQLGWSDLSGALLSGADLSGANLIGANLKAAKMTEAKLEGVILNGAIMTGANLQKALLRRADLNWVDFRHADLSGADLSEANLGWAILKDAKLEGAKFSGTTYNQLTVWPEGFDPVQVGCVLVAGELN